MFVLRLLGTASLEAADGALSGRVLERRALACLAVLAVEREPVTREKLAGLLWGERPERAALHRLSDVIYVVRSALGERSVLSVGGALRLGPVVESDAGEFLGALERGELERAVSLYRGPLLDGLYVTRAPVFERWLDERRQTFERRCADALERLAVEASGSGEPAASASWWKRRAEIELWNSRNDC